MRRFFFICLSLSLVSLYLLPKANASTMSNDQYSIEKRSVNIQPFVPEQPKKPTEKTHKPLASGKNFTVETNKPDSFSFHISQDLIDFGKLTTTNPVLRDLHLTVTSSEGYQVLFVQDHPLRTKNNLTIPDTTCDNGSCSEITGASWTNTLTYGFGYHSNGMSVDTYKQAADSSRNEDLQYILQGAHAQNREEKVTFKVNISGTQTSGAYSNVLTVIATPDF